jgi:hypothetical protein
VGGNRTISAERPSIIVASLRDDRDGRKETLMKKLCAHSSHYPPLWRR